MNKLGKIVLAGTIALGGLGVTSVAMPTEKASAAYKSDIMYNHLSVTSYSANTLTVNTGVNGDNSRMNDFFSKHNATFTIHNTAGTVVQRGSLNKWVAVQPYNNVYSFESNTNVSVSSLAAGHYRIKIQYPMDDGTMTNFATFSSEMSYHFYVNSNRTITEINQ